MNDAGVTKAMADQTIELRIFGIGITEETGIAFTKYDKGDEYATVCQVTATKVFKVGSFLLFSFLEKVLIIRFQRSIREAFGMEVH